MVQYVNRYYRDNIVYDRMKVIYNKNMFDKYIPLSLILVVYTFF